MFEHRFTVAVWQALIGGGWRQDRYDHTVIAKIKSVPVNRRKPGQRRRIDRCPAMADFFTGAVEISAVDSIIAAVTRLRAAAQFCWLPSHDHSPAEPVECDRPV